MVCMIYTAHLPFVDVLFSTELPFDFVSEDVKYPNSQYYVNDWVYKRSRGYAPSNCIKIY